MLDGRAIDANDAKRLATLPPRSELLTQLVGGLNAPDPGLRERALAAPARPRGRARADQTAEGGGRRLGAVPLPFQIRKVRRSNGNDQGPVGRRDQGHDRARPLRAREGARGGVRRVGCSRSGRRGRSGRRWRRWRRRGRRGADGVRRHPERRGREEDPGDQGRSRGHRASASRRPRPSSTRPPARSRKASPARRPTRSRASWKRRERASRSSSSPGAAALCDGPSCGRPVVAFGSAVIATVASLTRCRRPWLQRAKRASTSSSYYPRPVRIDGVRLIVSPLAFSSRGSRRFDGWATHRAIFVRRPELLDDADLDQPRALPRLADAAPARADAAARTCSRTQTNPYELQARRAAGRYAPAGGIESLTSR